MKRPMTDQKRAVFPAGTSSDAGPPFSPGLVVGDAVYVAGQGPLDPHTHEIAGTTIEEQTRLTLENVRRVLEAAGCAMDDCVKVTAHLARIEDFDRYNAVYRTFFEQPYPVRTTVQSVLWGGMLVEIDAVAVKGCAR